MTKPGLPTTIARLLNLVKKPKDKVEERNNLETIEKRYREARSRSMPALSADMMTLEFTTYAGIEIEVCSTNLTDERIEAIVSPNRRLQNYKNLKTCD